MIFGSVHWILVLPARQLQTAPIGMIVLFFSGIAQGVALVTMATILLRNSDPKRRS